MKILTSLLLSAYLLMGSEISWYHDFGAGLKAASLSNKKVVLMLSAEHCKVCNTMKKTVFTDKDVITKQNKKFISVMLDVKKDKVPENIKVFGTPSFYLLSAKGEIIDTKIGGSNLYGWNKHLNKISQ